MGTESRDRRAHAVTDISVTDVPEIVREHGLREGELWQILIQERFDGRYWDSVAEALVLSGRKVLLSKMSSGRIFRETREAGRPVPRSDDRPLSADEITDVVHETVVQALRLFRKMALNDEGWRPGREASMATYFAGTCTLTFKNAYQKCRSRTGSAEVPTESIDDLCGPADGPEDQVALDDLIRRITGGGDMETIVRMKLNGHRHGDIGHTLGISVKAVEDRLRKLRETTRKRGNRER